jgi:hypothetical protein
MKKMLLFFLAVITIFWGNSVFKVGEATAAASFCKECHPDCAVLLPKDHSPVESDVASCLDCHQSSLPAAEKKNPFLTRIHLAHHPPLGEGDCLACHLWSSGKSFGLINAAESWGAPTQQEMEILKEIFASWATSKFTDNLHARADVSCAGCHATKLPQLDATVENKKCLECHGPMENLAKATEPAEFKDRNPHKSHLGEIDCTVCHKAHGESKVYCLGCHQKFAMAIPGAGTLKE